MNDDEQLAYELREKYRLPEAADRFVALLAELAVLRAGAGRVPESWNECADWLDWFGSECVLDSAGRPTGWSAEMTRRWTDDGFTAYRLLPPPNLVAAPPGMDEGGYLGAGKDVPKGWEWRYAQGGGWFRWTGRTQRPSSDTFVQCRPPQPVVRPVVEVPLTRLVGRVIEGETEPVFCPPAWAGKWKWRGADSRSHVFPDGTLDLDTGLVRVYKDGES
jgi:hypothetical protein